MGMSLDVTFVRNCLSCSGIILDINTPCGQNAEIFILHDVVHIITTGH